jgi:hypothetical protein
MQRQSSWGRGGGGGGGGAAGGAAAALGQGFVFSEGTREISRDVMRHDADAAAASFQLFPPTPPTPQLLPTSMEVQMADCQAAITIDMQRSPFYLPDREPQTLPRYSERYRETPSRRDLLESWLPSPACSSYFPAELLVAADMKRFLSGEEAAAATAAASGTAAIPGAGRARRELQSDVAKALAQLAQQESRGDIDGKDGKQAEEQDAEEDGQLEEDSADESDSYGAGGGGSSDDDSGGGGDGGRDEGPSF